MKIRVCIFAILLVLAAFILPDRAYGEERTHLVQRGETFFSIARSNGIRAEDLMRHNGFTDPSRLQVGQRLRIPGSAPAGNAPVAAGVSTYRVVRGDTLFGIARKFSVSVASLRQANNLSESHVLREGQTLRLPPEARIPPGAAVQQTQPPRVVEAPRPANAGPAPPPPRPVPPRAVEAPRPGAGGSGTLDPSVRWPIVPLEINYMTGKLSGVVITGVRGEPVISLTRGTVLSAGPYRGFGRVVIVQVDGGYLFVYGGNESLSVREGDRVAPGTELGRLGVDAVTNRPQLFFMVYRANAPVNPARAPRGI